MSLELSNIKNYVFGINNDIDRLIDNEGPKPQFGPLRRINYKQYFKSKLPVLSWLPHYNLGYFAHDLLAGFTVSLTEVPQGIAYAAVAGLPLQYGLYSGFMGCFMYFIFGTVKDINMGPTAILALLIQPHVTAMGPDMAPFLSFLSGCIILILGLLHLGFVVDFFSYPVIAGFTSAAALNIASSQIKSLLGVSGSSDTFLEAWESVIKNIDETRKWDLLLGILSMLFLFITKEISRFGSLKYRPEWSPSRNVVGKILFFVSLTRNAVAVLVGSILAYCLDGTDDGKNPFKLTGSVKQGMPPFKPPPFSTSYNGTDYSFMDMAEDYGTALIFCPLVAMLETFAIAKVFTKGKALDGTQEMVALGAANIMGSFVGSMPVTGSFTRTAVNNASGVKTPAGGLLTASIVLLSLNFLTSSFYFIPKTSLAAVILVAMFYIFDFEAFPVLWKTKKLEMIPFLVTLVAGCLLSLEYGILLGVVVDFAFILYAVARPKLVLTYEKLPQGEVYIITPRITLHFPSAEHLRETVLRDCVAANATVVIDGRNIRNTDVTVAKTYTSLVKELLGRDQKIVFWNFKKSVMDVCVQVDKNVAAYFREGELEQVIDDPATDRVSIDMSYTIQ